MFSDATKSAGPAGEGLTLTVDAYEASPIAAELDAKCTLMVFLDLDNCPGELELLCGETLPPTAVVYDRAIAVILLVGSSAGVQLRVWRTALAKDARR